MVIFFCWEQMFARNATFYNGPDEKKLKNTNINNNFVIGKCVLVYRLCWMILHASCWMLNVEWWIIIKHIPFTLFRHARNTVKMEFHSKHSAISHRHCILWRNQHTYAFNILWTTFFITFTVSGCEFAKSFDFILHHSSQFTTHNSQLTKKSESERSDWKLWNGQTGNLERVTRNK